MIEGEDRSNKIRPELSRFESILENGSAAVMVGAWFGLLKELETVFNDISTKGIAQVSEESGIRAAIFTVILISEYLAYEEMNK